MLAVLNNREVALIFWVGVLLVWMLFNRDLRVALGGVLAAASQRAALASTAALAGYCVGAVLLASRLGFWRPDLVKETVIWFVGIGIGLLMNLGGSQDQEHRFRHEAAKAVRVRVFVEFFINLAVLPLPLELLLLPLLATLAMMPAVAEGQGELRPAKTFVDGLLGLLGVGLFLARTPVSRSVIAGFSRASIGRAVSRTSGFGRWRTAGMSPEPSSGSCSSVASASSGSRPG